MGEWGKERRKTHLSTVALAKVEDAGRKEEVEEVEEVEEGKKDARRTTHDTRKKTRISEK